MEEDQETFIIGLLGIVYMRNLLQKWLKDRKGNALMLDEDKASVLFPWLLSGMFDEDLIIEVLGLSKALYTEIRTEFMN